MTGAPDCESRELLSAVCRLHSAFSLGTSVAIIVYETVSGSGTLLLVASTTERALEQAIAYGDSQNEDRIAAALAMGGPHMVSGDSVAQMPSDWKQLAGEGCICLLPLSSSYAELFDDKSSAIGLAIAVFPHEPNAGQIDLALLQRFGDALAEKLTLDRCARELRCRRQAMSRLRNVVQTTLLRDINSANHVDANPTARRRRRRGGRTMLRRRGLRRQRHVLLTQAINAVCEILDLSRCAVLLPAPNAPHFWRLEVHRGFPGKIVTHGFYVRGEGLTGRILKCAAGDVVNSSHIEVDERRSLKFGDTWLRESNSSGPMAFLGVPIFSRFQPRETQPHGALVCIRDRQHTEDERFFSTYEEELAEIAATALAYGLDTLYWREDAAARGIRQLDLSRLWESGRSEEQKVSDALRLLQHEVPFKRLLLAMVDHRRKAMVGKGVVGFRSELLAETRRQLFSETPDPPEAEDILAYIWRHRILAPFVVDPNDPEDELAKHVHQPTALQHEISNRLLLIPMSNNAGDVVGVVLAEFPDDIQQLSEEDLEHFSTYANQIARLIGSEDSRIDARRERRMLLSLLRELGEQINRQPSTAEGVLRALLTHLCDQGDFDQGVIYVYDAENRLLEGRLGYRVNHRNVLETTYDDAPDDNRDRHKQSFARRIFLSGRTEFVLNLNTEPVDQKDRVAVGIEADSRGVGVPMRLGDRTYGVVLIFGQDVTQPNDELQRRLERYARIGALAIAVEQLVVRLSRSRKEAISQNAIVHTIGRIATDQDYSLIDDLDDYARKARPAVDAILESAASVFDAPLCCLYLADSTVRIDPNSTFDRRKSLRDAHFLLRAGVGHDEGRIGKREFGYNIASHGLTAAVLKTLRPHVSSNVEEDPLWSRRTKEIEGLRTWMGVPVMLEENDGLSVFGVLTFTRRRKSERDALFFNDHDVRTAENIAGLIALALHNRQQMKRVRDAIHELLHWFLHDIPMRLALINSTHIPTIDKTLKDETLLRETVVEQVAQQCEHITILADFAVSGFYAYQSFAGARVIWQPEPNVDVGPIARVVNRVVEAEFLKTGLELSVGICDEGVRCSVDRHKLLYILHALVHNAATSSARKSQATPRVKTVVQLSDNELIVSVEDNGEGFTSQEAQEFLNERFSGTGSTGLGLTIVQRLLQGIDGTLHFSGVSGTGAIVTVRIPTAAVN